MEMPDMIIQSPDEVVAFLKAQHNLIEDMFDQVLHASDPHAREEPFVQLRQLLAVHETAEEMVVHPRVRREVDAIDSIVDARLEEEHEAKELLSKIEKIDITSRIP
jgi:hemerythrin superfamily protein